MAYTLENRNVLNYTTAGGKLSCLLPAVTADAVRLIFEINNVSGAAVGLRDLIREIDIASGSSSYLNTRGTEIFALLDQVVTRANAATYDDRTIPTGTTAFRHLTIPGPFAFARVGVTAFELELNPGCAVNVTIDTSVSAIQSGVGLCYGRNDMSNSARVFDLEHPSEALCTHTIGAQIISGSDNLIKVFANGNLNRNTADKSVAVVAVDQPYLYKLFQAERDEVAVQNVATGSYAITEMLPLLWGPNKLRLEYSENTTIVAFTVGTNYS